MMTASNYSRTALSNVLAPRVSPTVSSARALVHALADSLSSEGHMPYSDARRVFERAWIEGMLRRYGFNQCMAAKRMDMHRNTLARKIGEHGIEIPSSTKGLSA